MIDPRRFFGRIEPVCFMIEGTRPDFGQPEVPRRAAGVRISGGLPYSIVKVQNLRNEHEEWWGGGYAVVHPEGDAIGCGSADQIDHMIDLLGVLRTEYGLGRG